MKKVVIIGAGINGLVAANYLARAGFAVTVIERKDHPGGACCAGTLTHEGATYTYPQGASVLGFMQDFIFKETGLDKKVFIGKPSHPEVVYLADGGKPLLASDFSERATWNEQGHPDAFSADMERVAEFLRQGYRDAVVPTLATAEKAIGPELTKRWITGSARDLLDYYLTSDILKVFYAISVYESGPVSLEAPYSAFTIPLMASGGVFGGEWGYVKDGIWQIPLALHELNTDLGVTTIFSARVRNVSQDNLAVSFEKDGRMETLPADYVLFATDPLTAANILNEEHLREKISSGKLLGTSGKLVLFFKNPVRWKNATGLADFESAFRHIIPVANLKEAESTSHAVVNDNTDFTPGYFEIYCEGAGNRSLGGQRDYDLVSVFFKNMAFREKGENLPEVKEQVARYILDKI